MSEAATAPNETRVLVVEDEAMIAFDLVDMLEDLGFSDVVVANSFEAAQEALDKGGIAIAFFDLNLDGQLSTPLIERAVGEGIFTVVASGYEARTVATPPGVTVPRLPKPYDARMVSRVLAQRALAGGEARPT